MCVCVNELSGNVEKSSLWFFCLFVCVLNF